MILYSRIVEMPATFHPFFLPGYGDQGKSVNLDKGTPKTASYPVGLPTGILNQ